MRTTTRLLATAVALASLTLAAHEALAQADPRVEAERLFAQAEQAITKLDFQAACPKLEEVVRLQPQGIGAKMKLAECYVGLGRLKAAHDTLGSAAQQAHQAGQPDRASSALEKQQALAMRLPRLQVKVPATVDQLKVEHNRQELAASEWNKDLPIELGRHVIRASAPGHSPFETVLEASEGARLQVNVELKLQVTQIPTDALAASQGESPSLPEQPSADRGGLGGVQLAGIVLGGAGVAMLATGIGVGVDGLLSANEALDRYTEARDAGNGAVQNAAAAEYETKYSQNTAGWVVAGVGGAAAVSGLLMAVLGSPAPTSGADVNTSWTFIPQWSGTFGGVMAVVELP